MRYLWRKMISLITEGRYFSPFDGKCSCWPNTTNWLHTFSVIPKPKHTLKCWLANPVSCLLIQFDVKQPPTEKFFSGVMMNSYKKVGAFLALVLKICIYCWVYCFCTTTVLRTGSLVRSSLFGIFPTKFLFIVSIYWVPFLWCFST